MDPVEYIQRNREQIRRSSNENSLNIDLALIIKVLIAVIEITKERREDRYSTDQFYDEWLRSHRPEFEKVYRQWLIRAFNDDASFVFAKNALIRSLNRDFPRGNDQDTIPQVSTNIWESYLKVKYSKDLRPLKDEIRYLFPECIERNEFLHFAVVQLKKDTEGCEAVTSNKVDLVQELLAETKEEIREESNLSKRQKDRTPKAPLATYDNGIAYVNLFKEPDQEKNAELVKVVLDDMGLTKNGKLTSTFRPEPHTGINTSTDQIDVKKNTLAYVFAALKDPDKGVGNIHYGEASKQLKVFYAEFGKTAADTSKQGDVTIRNLRKVLANNHRHENIVYRNFTYRYKKLTEK